MDKGRERVNGVRVRSQNRSLEPPSVGYSGWAGSRDPGRYPAGLGVEFLAQLGEATSAILDPYLPGPRPRPRKRVVP